MAAPLRTPETLWYGRHVGVGTRALRLSLVPLEATYAFGTAVRRALYQTRILRPDAVAARVVAVGNVVVGGAGKTPVVMALAQAARDAGVRVAVVSRGYGGHAGGAGVQVSRGEGPLVGAELCGDEPWLMATRLRGVPVFAGPDRAVLSRRAIEEHGCELIILDDGMQHLRLRKDALIAVVRLPAPFGNGHLLPAGPLRERPRGLSGADAVVALRQSGSVLDEDQRALAEAGVAADRVLHARVEPAGIVELGGATVRPPEWLEGRAVVAAAAIARPSQFVATLQDAGARVVESVALPDHAAFGAGLSGELNKRARAAGAQAVVVTEKDAARLPVTAGGDVPICVLRVRLRFEREDALGRLLAILWPPLGRG